MKKNKKKVKLKFRFKLLIFIMITIIYTFTLGTKGLFVKEYVIKTKKAETDTMIKLVHFSDLLYDNKISERKLNNITNKINSLNPDIVIFSGDLVKKNYTIKNKDKEKLTFFLNNIDSELGNYYVQGDEDFDTSINILNEANFINIDKSINKIYTTSNNYIYLLDKKSDIESIKEDQSYKVLIVHNPNSINKLDINNYDLIVAGHTLNGSINIPKVKDLFMNTKYTYTHKKINNTDIFINPGLGTNKINARLFNHPTIYVYKIKK